MNNSSLESVVVFLPKQQIELDLNIYGSRVKVVGSRFTEDGIELVLEGDKQQVSKLLTIWGNN